MTTSSIKKCFVTVDLKSDVEYDDESNFKRKIAAFERHGNC